MSLQRHDLAALTHGTGTGIHLIWCWVGLKADLEFLEIRMSTWFCLGSKSESSSL